MKKEESTIVLSQMNLLAVQKIQQLIAFIWGVDEYCLHGLTMFVKKGGGAVPRNTYKAKVFILGDAVMGMVALEVEFWLMKWKPENQQSTLFKVRFRGRPEHNENVIEYKSSGNSVSFFRVFCSAENWKYSFLDDKSEQIMAKIYSDIGLTRHIDFGEKRGEGVGATLPFFTKEGWRIGNLTFHDQQDWQVTDSSQADKFDWDHYFETALRFARKQYPKG